MGLYLIKKNFHEIIDIADIADRYNYQNGTASNYKVLCILLKQSLKSGCSFDIGNSK